MEGFDSLKEDDIENICANRLEELKILVQEPELSNEQLHINDQLQVDEIMAMEAIYGESLIVLKREDGLRSFQMNIYVETPNELTISTKLHSSSLPVNYGGKTSQPTIETDNSNELLYSFKVQYLPPIVLTCLLPKSYPSHVCPCFTISLQWLDSMRISNLCNMLDSIWMDQLGQEVLFQWVEWLQTCSLSYLGFDKDITLGPYNMPEAEDRRSVSGHRTPDVVIPSMMNYNEDKSHEAFQQDIHECCICYSEYAGKDFIRLPCKHFFCWKCMETYSNIHVKEGTVNKFLCPEPKCGGMVPPEVLKRLLSDEDFEQWESLLLQKTLDSMSDIVYCPRCDKICIEDHEDHHAQCTNCFFSFCGLCRDPRHVGTTCMSAEEKLTALEERQNLRRCKLSDERKRKAIIEMNELISLREISLLAKQCPSCKMAIMRDGGCNHMVCRNCGQHFCYLCNKQIADLGHFRGSCNLFPQRAIIEWERQMNGIGVAGGRNNQHQANRRRLDEPELDEQQLMRQINAEIYADYAHSCPICRQKNVKVDNNNHILCWSCQSHYCYTCRKIVKSSSQHYGPKGCKQHTVS